MIQLTSRQQALLRFLGGMSSYVPVRELARQFGVSSIPTLVVMKEGRITNQAMGARPKSQILALL